MNLGQRFGPKSAKEKSASFPNAPYWWRKAMNLPAQIQKSLEQAESLLLRQTSDHKKGQCDCGYCMALNNLWLTIGQVEMAALGTENSDRIGHLVSHK